jgi:hypothetical protein
LSRRCTAKADVSNYFKAEGGETGQSHLNAKASIVDIATEVESDWQQIVRKLIQAYCKSTEWFTQLFIRI